MAVSVDDVIAVTAGYGDAVLASSSSQSAGRRGGAGGGAGGKRGSAATGGGALAWEPSTGVQLFSFKHCACKAGGKWVSELRSQ